MSVSEGQHELTTSVGEQRVKSEPSWFILTSLEPKETEEKLKEAIALHGGAHPVLKQYFIPYQYLKRRMSDEALSGSAEDDSYFNPKARVNVAANNEIRSALRRYVFVRAHEKELAAFLKEEWNYVGRNRLQFFRDKRKQRVSVPDRMMNQFIEACTDYKLRFELLPPVDDIKEKEVVMLNTTPFKGEKAHVLEVVHTKEGVNITVGIQLFSGTMLLRMQHVSEKDIIREHQPDQQIDVRHLIDNTQRRILAILSRVVNRKQTEETKRKDAAMLDMLYNYRYHTLSHPAANRHFLALMLICAHLRHDATGQAELIEKAQRELETIHAKGDSKSATDVRTYLQAALYIATGNPQYRDEAKSYVQEYEPKSEALRRLVRLIRKRQI